MSLRLVDADLRFDARLSSSEPESVTFGMDMADVDQVIADLQGDPPKNLCNAGSLPPRRAKLARAVAQRRKLADELAALETKRTELEAMIAAPAETAASIRDAVKRTADWLLGRGGDNSDASKRKALEDEEAAQRHRAEAAAAALPELAKPIAVARLRLKHVADREPAYLSEALSEVADEIGLGRAYARKIAELRELASLIHGLCEVAAGFGSGFDKPVSVRLARPGGIPSLRHTTANEFTIAAQGDAEIWRKAAAALLNDPLVKASKLVSFNK